MKRYSGLALRLAVSAGCLWLAISLVPDGMGGLLREARPEWLLVLLGSNLLAIGVMASRLRLLTGGRISLGAAVVVTWVGQFGTTLGLGLVSADGARITRLAQTGYGLGDAARLVLLDRIFGLSGLVVLTAGAWITHLAGIGAGLATSVATSGTILLALAVAWRFRKLSGLAPGRQVRLPVQIAALSISILLHAVSIAGFAAAILAVGATPPMPETIVAVAIGLFFAILPVSLGGWGVRELAVAQGFVAVGVVFEAAIAASLIYGIAVTLIALPGVTGLVTASDAPANRSE